MGVHLISTRAVEQSCQCGTEILAGVAEGLTARVDAKPIDPASELAALVEGRRTYALNRSGELVYRDHYRIRGGLTGTGIHAEHRCVSYVQPSLIGAAT